MKDRIKRIRKEFDLTQQEMADKIGIKRNSLANYETGRNTPIDAIIVSICREFNINEEWLRTGEGEMFIKQTRDEKIAGFIGTIQMKDDDSFKKRMISMLSDLTEEQWELLADMVETLTKIPEYQAPAPAAASDQEGSKEK